MSETQPEDNAREEFRRVWGKQPPPGASRITRKAMGTLWDAGVPITGHEIADRLVPLLDAYERDYLEAWYLRRLQTVRRTSTGDDCPLVSLPNIQAVVRRWLNDSFYGRTKGGTLIRDPDGRFRPGHKALRMLTSEGRLKAFTQETRSDLAQAEHDRGRVHLGGVELDSIKADCDIATPTDVEHFKSLAKRFLGEPPKFDEHRVRNRLARVKRLADTEGARLGILKKVDEL